MISASSSSVGRLEEQALGVIDQVTAPCEELVVLFTNGAKQIDPSQKLIVLVEAVRFGGTDGAIENMEVGRHVRRGSRTIKARIRSGVVGY